MGKVPRYNDKKDASMNIVTMLSQAVIPVFSLWDMEQKALMEKVYDKRLTEALKDVNEERQITNQWKRKAQKCGTELQHLRLMLEKQMARNGDLEKK
ncbi:hypothetical protein HNY73_021582 [Argiope bruennichi]|uniref:Uncharacterized protein n=1 Tax=Argiope bruennichi TaxID=94029 RepID=A0A8T0E277_ARGBR|nr:hypothetical protein HNY73_021582 [Argiope bruennichi]